MQKHLATAFVAVALVVVALPLGAHASGPAVGANDDKITGGIQYVRYDGGTDATIQLCNDRSPDVFGAYTQNNEPFSVVSPGDPNLVLTGWNDYCSGWMGLGFSTDGGSSWTDSLVPGYVGDTSAGGQASPEFGRTNAASAITPTKTATSAAFRQDASSPGLSPALPSAAGIPPPAALAAREPLLPSLGEIGRVVEEAAVS